MNSSNRLAIAVLAVVGMGFISSQAWACANCGCSAKGKTAKAATEVKAQTTCPVMGGKVSENSPYVDVKGHRVYVCCKGCIAKVQAEPDKYLDKIRAQGETPAKAVELCDKCGETKGTEKCCLKGAVKCDGCGKTKGSPGCCK